MNPYILLQSNIGSRNRVLSSVRGNIHRIYTSSTISCIDTTTATRSPSISPHIYRHFKINLYDFGLVVRLTRTPNSSSEEEIIMTGHYDFLIPFDMSVLLVRCHYVPSNLGTFRTVSSYWCASGREGL